MKSKDRQSESKPHIRWPVAHVLALAPLDVWVRMIARSSGVHPRYWLRLSFILITSFVGTISTVHERLLMHLLHRKRFAGDSAKIDQPVVVILGYYRSGTTHLHNLMSCDERYVTPKWYQCLAGQGFWVGWSVLRFVLIPFLGSSRPQDAVGFGPGWPGEDDFALASWGGCSSLAGRFVWPSSGWKDWKRWHTLDDLDEQERARWRSLMSFLVWKISRGRSNRDKTVLLKTPSHSAKVRELDDLCQGRVKFVHLVREPGAVIDSNVRLHDSLRGHLLEDGPDVNEVRQRVVDEYEMSESLCRSQLDEIDADRWVRIRYQDLRADPIRTLEQIYTELGMSLDEKTEHTFQSYLSDVGEYRSEKKEIALGDVSDHEREVCQEMIQTYGLDEPSVNAKKIDAAERTQPRTFWGLVSCVCFIGALCGVWLLIVWGLHSIDESIKMRLIPLGWIFGSVLGYGVQRVAGRGSHLLGVIAAIGSVMIVLLVAFPTTVINHNFASTDGYSTGDWIYHNAKGGYEGLKSVSSLVLVTLGAMSAYRLASHAGPDTPRTHQRRMLG